jgi:protein YibB
MYTIVTAYFDIDRGNWDNKFKRDTSSYLQKAKRMLSLDDFMVIYTEPKFLDFVKEQRRKYIDKTRIISVTQEELPYYSIKDSIKNIMESDKFKEGLVNPTCPEVCVPMYDVIMWSKVPIVCQAIESNFFNTTHFVWLDFGINDDILPDDSLNKQLLPDNIPDKLRFLCRKIPTQADLDIEVFYKSNSNRFAGGLFSGDIEHFQKLEKLFEDEVENCLKERLVDCDQSIFAVIALKNSVLFSLYSGDWNDLITGYLKTL